MSANIHIVCSSKRAVGKTLFARICGDILSFSEHGVTVFDTAFPSGPLARWFPKNSEVIDFRKVREQVRLFDTIVEKSGKNYVIELQPEYMETFFTILHDTGFDQGAREFDIGTGVFFLHGLSEDTGKQISLITGKLRVASLTIVANDGRNTAKRLYAGSPGAVFRGNCRQTTLPRLSPTTLEWLEKPGSGFGWYYGGSASRPPPEVRLELSFLMERLRDWSRLPAWTERLAL